MLGYIDLDSLEWQNYQRMYAEWLRCIEEAFTDENGVLIYPSRMSEIDQEKSLLVKRMGWTPSEIENALWDSGFDV